MPPAWWTHVVLDRAQAPVSTQDAKLVFEFITRRLVERDASGDTRGAQCDMWIEKLDGVTAVGDLHEAIEAFGPDAWRTFRGVVEFWWEAAGIVQP